VLSSCNTLYDGDTYPLTTYNDSVSNTSGDVSFDVDIDGSLDVVNSRRAMLAHDHFKIITLPDVDAC